MQAGRGFGKTILGSQWVRYHATTGVKKRIALAGRTVSDVRDTMIEGETGIRTISPRWDGLHYEPSKRRIIWPTRTSTLRLAHGSIAATFTSDQPEQARGPQHHLVWADELAAWKRHARLWTQLKFGLRLGDNPRGLITTTPRPVRVIRELVANPKTIVTRGTTRDNAHNLAAAFLEEIVNEYEGTTLGRQELDGELLDDIPGALWKRSLIDDHRRHERPKVSERVVVAVDPPASAEGAEAGIVTCELGGDGDFYVIGDRSKRGRPNVWARAAVEEYDRVSADRIIGEVNNGGDMVEEVIRTVESYANDSREDGKPPRDRIAYKAIHASRGKKARAEPIVALYEQGRVHHVGLHPELEDQMCTWIEGDDESPDRMDALVWGLTELSGKAIRGRARRVVADPDSGYTGDRWDV